jgi:hypothetical protein
VDPTAGLDDVEKKKFFTLPGLELRPLGRSARNQSLYRLQYPAVEKSKEIKMELSNSREIWQNLLREPMAHKRLFFQ